MLNILTQEILNRYQVTQGYVYLIHAIGTDRYKIGRSVNPISRLDTLKGQSPYPLKIIECFWTPDMIADEKYFHNHQYLANKKRHGEWFEFTKNSSEGISLSPFQYIELQFTDHRPTCSKYLKQYD